MIRLNRFFLIVFASLLFLSGLYQIDVYAKGRAPSTKVPDGDWGVKPPDKPLPPQPEMTAEKRKEVVERRWDAMCRIYSKALERKYPIARCVACISFANVPGDKATEALLECVTKDRDHLVRCTAWQALLGRAGELTDEQYKKWEKATLVMAKGRMIHGDLRIGLFDFLGSTPVTQEARTIFINTFKTTNSLCSGDISTLIAMGKALGSWRDATLVERTLFPALGSPNTVVRAELVLQAAGVCPPWNRTSGAQAAYRSWWTSNKQSYTGGALKEARWKQLKPQYLPKPNTIDTVDLTSYDEMELPKFEINHFDLVVSIDVSRSMGGEIRRLRRDLCIIHEAIKTVCKEPRMGLTIYAPGGMQWVKAFPLTPNFSQIQGVVNQLTIMGPPGHEEWAGSLSETMSKSRWSKGGKEVAKVILLISDEPIEDNQGKRCLTIAQQAANEGFQIFGVKVASLKNVVNNPLSLPFDRTPATIYDNPKMLSILKSSTLGGKHGSYKYYTQIAEITNAATVTIAVPQGVLGQGLPLSTLPLAVKGEKPRKSYPDSMNIAPLYPGGGPTNAVMTKVLLKTVNPQYAGRVAPLVYILMAYCQKSAVQHKEQRVWATPNSMEPNTTAVVN